MANLSNKILFICGSLEPGRDGVGDYTRMLAGELISRGVDVQIIAINDRGINNLEREIQFSRGIPVSVMRLSQSLSQRVKKNYYKTLVSEFHPNWISLQFVPYAFSRRGIPFGLPSFLKLRDKEVNWHIMIHESYINSGRTLKGRVIQKSQIMIIKNIVSKVKPNIIHTTTREYKKRIEKIGIKTLLLGLFGNIPVIEQARIKPHTTYLMRGIYFGAAPVPNQFDLFINRINNFLSSYTGRLELSFCGGLGVHGPSFLNAIRRNISSANVDIKETGRLEDEDLSKLFLTNDFGISRVSPKLIGKSGSAIAMLEHGLPLWIPLAKDQNDIEENCDYRTNQCFANLTLNIIENQNFLPHSRLHEIVDSFSDDLSLMTVKSF